MDPPYNYLEDRAAKAFSGSSSSITTSIEITTAASASSFGGSLVSVEVVVLQSKVKVVLLAATTGRILGSMGSWSFAGRVPGGSSVAFSA